MSFKISTHYLSERERVKRRILECFSFWGSSIGRGRIGKGVFTSHWVGHKDWAAAGRESNCIGGGARERPPATRRTSTTTTHLASLADLPKSRWLRAILSPEEYTRVVHFQITHLASQKSGKDCVEPWHCRGTKHRS